MNPIIAAWTPHLIALVVGLYLIYMRSMNKDLPKLTPAGIISMFRSSRDDSSVPVQSRAVEEQPRPEPVRAKLGPAPETAKPAEAPAESTSSRPARARRTEQVTSSRRRVSEFDMDFD